MIKRVIFLTLAAFQLSAGSINLQIHEILKKDREKIASLKEKMADTSRHTPPSVKLELARTELALGIKKKLARNYIGTAILQDSKVRKRLLHLLSLKKITQSDLTAFQQLVNEQKNFSRNNRNR